MIQQLSYPINTANTNTYPDYARHEQASVHTDSVKLVYEDDAGRLLLRLSKQLPHSSRPSPHKQLHELAS